MKGTWSTTRAILQVSASTPTSAPSRTRSASNDAMRATLSRRSCRSGRASSGAPGSAVFGGSARRRRLRCPRAFGGNVFWRGVHADDNGRRVCPDRPSRWDRARGRVRHGSLGGADRARATRASTRTPSQSQIALIPSSSARGRVETPSSPAQSHAVYDDGRTLGRGILRRRLAPAPGTPRFQIVAESLGRARRLHHNTTQLELARTQEEAEVDADFIDFDAQPWHALRPNADPQQPGREPSGPNGADVESEVAPVPLGTDDRTHDRSKAEQREEGGQSGRRDEQTSSSAEAETHRGRLG